MKKGITIEQVERIAEKLRAMPPTEKALKKLAREREKIEKQAKKAGQELNRLAVEKAKRDSARFHLPVDVGNESEWLTKEDGCLDGFVVVDDVEMLRGVVVAFEGERYSKIIGAIESAVDCDPSELCLIEVKEGTRDGKKALRVHFRFAFNPQFSDTLKELGRATWNKPFKTWGAPIECLRSADVQALIRQHFKFVVDITGRRIMCNPRPSALNVSRHVAFRELPYHKRFHEYDVLAALAGVRPHAEVYEVEREGLFYDNGSEFVRLPSQATVATRLPFLVFRYAVQDGRPRYFVFSVLGRCVEVISFGNADKVTARMIARFRDSSCRATLPVLEFDSSRWLPELPGQKELVWGPFGKFARDIERVEHVISEGCSFLCSDYVSLIEAGFGADSWAGSVVAYVHLGDRAAEYFGSIGEYFGSCLVENFIVFSREALDGWDVAGHEFLLTVAHELGHLYQSRNPVASGLGIDGVHGVGWAIYAAIIEYALFERFVRRPSTAYSEYHPEDAVTAMAIEAGLIKVVGPAYEDMGGFLMQPDFLEVANLCAREVERQLAP